MQVLTGGKVRNAGLKKKNNNRNGRPFHFSIQRHAALRPGCSPPPWAKPISMSNPRLQGRHSASILCPPWGSLWSSATVASLAVPPQRWGNLFTLSVSHLTSVAGFDFWCKHTRPLAEGKLTLLLWKTFKIRKELFDELCQFYVLFLLQLLKIEVCFFLVPRFSSESNPSRFSGVIECKYSLPLLIAWFN